MLSVINADCHLCSVSFISTFAPECHYERCYAECCYAECRYAECHYAECRRALAVAKCKFVKLFSLIFEFFKTYFSANTLDE